MTDFQDIVAEITKGDHDGHLGALFKAFFERANEIEVETVWRLKVGDDEWTVKTTGLAELAFAERMVWPQGGSYLRLDPMRSADHLVALIVARLHKTQGLKLQEALAEVSRLTAADLKDILIVEVDRVPKDDPGSEASTSS